MQTTQSIDLRHDHDTDAVLQEQRVVLERLDALAGGCAIDDFDCRYQLDELLLRYEGVAMRRRVVV